HVVEQLLDAVLRADVHRVAADLGDAGVLQRAHAELDGVRGGPGDDDLGAQLTEPGRAGQPDPPRTAGDQGDLPIQFRAHAAAPLRSKWSASPSRSRVALDLVALS